MLKTRGIAAKIFVAACSISSFPADSVAQEKPRMTIVICNQVGLGIEDLRGAEATNKHIFQNAGVAITWIEAGSTCTPTTTARNLPNTYFVVVTPQVPAGWSTGQDSMGLALRNDAYRHAYVFYDRVQEFVISMKLTRDLRITTSIVLGHVVAHELGHLLLGGKGPSGKGIMSEHWTSSDWRGALSGTLVFEPEDAKVIKDQLSAKFPRGR